MLPCMANILLMQDRLPVHRCSCMNNFPQYRSSLRAVLKKDNKWIPRPFCIPDWTNGTYGIMQSIHASERMRDSLWLGVPPQTSPESEYRLAYSDLMPPGSISTIGTKDYFSSWHVAPRTFIRLLFQSRYFSSDEEVMGWSFGYKESTDWSNLLSS